MKILWLVVAITSFACQNNNNDDDDYHIDLNTTVIILNEGAFGSGNASVSTYDPESGTVENDVFFKANGRSIGDVAQSSYAYDGKIFFSLNASNKLEVVDAVNMNERGAVSLVLPRYMRASGNKLFVSSWGAGGQVYIVNADNLQVKDSISVGTGPEQMLLNGNKLFIVNSGGFSEDSTLSIIDINSENLVSTLYVGDIPIDMVEDGDGHLWVLCKGKTLYDANWQVIGHTGAKMVEIDPVTDQILSTLVLFSDQHPSHIEISKDGTTVYIGGGYGFSGIYKLNLTTSGSAPQKIVDVNAYGFNVNPENDDIYVLEAPDFLNAGNLKIYSSNGLLKENHMVGIGPNSALFQN